MSKSVITPRVLKGFRDTLPVLAATRGRLVRQLEDVFSSFGFMPIDTPAIEYAEILLGKGSAETDRQLYRFLDNGERDVALRFDLTVPLARFMAMHVNEIGVPFRRYHMAPVWRAEKPQRGRFREFIQCDFDIIGSRSTLADAEIVSLIHSAFAALGMRHEIRLNHRMILNGFLASIGCPEKSVAVLRAVDKLDKFDKTAVAQELEEEAGLSKVEADRVFSFLDLSLESFPSSDLFGKLGGIFQGDGEGMRGVEELKRLLEIVRGAGISEDCLKVDLSIARGLDYYTGLVFETKLCDLPDIGSVCSGGRYDNLAGLYSKQELPGVGASIGLDRLLAAAEELGRISGNSVGAQVMIAVLDREVEPALMGIASELRRTGITVEIYPDEAKLGTQLKYADRRGAVLVVIAGISEIAQGICSVKELTSGRQLDGVKIDLLGERLKQLLAESSLDRSM